MDGDFTSTGNKRTLDVAKVDLPKPVKVVDKSIVNLVEKATVTFRMVNSALMVSGVVLMMIYGSTRLTGAVSGMARWGCR